MKYVLIIGAKSDIAKELARTYAKNKYNLYLAARNAFELNDLAKDLEIRYDITALTLEFDITYFNTHQVFFDNLEIKPIGVIIASGYMANQKDCESDFNKTLNTINVNYLGAVSILNIFANYFSLEKTGFIVGISSVAGDRGRAKNYIYGSSKAAFSAYLSGLRNRLFKDNVFVLTVKPGFVYTKMTEHLDLKKHLTTDTKTVAQAIFQAQQKSKDILYIKPIWRLIMLLIKLIPEKIFKRTYI